MLPADAPETVGLNVAVKLIFCPAAIAWPADNPLMLYPAPLALATEIVTGAVPVLDNFTVWLLLCPTDTFPKPTDVGDMLRTPCVAVPVSESVSGEFDALLVMVRVPVTAPVDCGANWT
jgi:hypothetical protein